MSNKAKWGDIFDKYLAEGCDYADAAYRADEWEKLNSRKNKQMKIINPATLAESAYQGYNSVAKSEKEWKDLSPATKQAWIAAMSKAVEDFTLGQKSQ